MNKVIKIISNRPLLITFYYAFVYFAKNTHIQNRGYFVQYNETPIYIIIYKICPLYANKIPLFCPPEKNGNSRRGNRLRFHFNHRQYVYIPSVLGRFCIIIRL